MCHVLLSKKSNARLYEEVLAFQMKRMMGIEASINRALSMPG
jgi:hypothetical protein